MLICGPQSIVDVVTSTVIPAEENRPNAAVEFMVRVETDRFTASRWIHIEESDARTFVFQLWAISQVRQAAVTLTATPADDFQLHIGFIGQTGRVRVNGRLAATDAGERAPALEFGFEFDPSTLPAIVAECQRWIAPPRPAHYLCSAFQFLDGLDDARAHTQYALLESIVDKLGYELSFGSPRGGKLHQLWAVLKESPAHRDERVLAFERRFLAWLHIRFGVLPKPKAAGGTNAPSWTFVYNESATVNFAILGPGDTVVRPSTPAVEWLLRVEEAEPAEFIERVERHFRPGSGIRRRWADGQIQVQFNSAALTHDFTDQTDVT